MWALGENPMAYLRIFPELFAKLNALGGKWSARSIVFEHTMQEANGTQPQLRLELINEVDMRFTESVVSAGNRTYAEGVNTPIVGLTELLLIHADFAMDWGYANQRSLGPHYTIFYSPDFVQQSVNVALCWMGIGWLDPNRAGGPLMQDTDMVAFVKDGQDPYAEREDAALNRRRRRSRHQNALSGEQMVALLLRLDRAISAEEPLKDELLVGQRSDDAGNPLNGVNDLQLIPGEGCACTKYQVQFRRPFATDDLSDITLPVRSAKIGLIFAFARKDPFET
ncbi:hypothetical protein AK812_SmicGene15634 [Symbiodinium microadriaticum]|uniref:Uncharacterized protein n=1 Tax=Symbiodinium microadriaticum TaxID=2951 RepID=A0A1Q9E2F4_SYMMI|nr:hypothetical protein AK812_SmicGene15634 [Symbiodinium microadriaticum]